MTRNSPLSVFLLLSVLVHCAVLLLFSGTGIFDLSAPVAAGAISVDLTDGVGAPAIEVGAGHPPVEAGRNKRSFSGVYRGTANGSVGTHHGHERGGEGKTVSAIASGNAEASVDPPHPQEPAPVQAEVDDMVQAKAGHAAPPPDVAPAPVSSAPAGTSPTAMPRQLHLPPPLRQAGEFLGVTRETLTYRITLHGVKVGEATLDATNDNGAVRIVVKVSSAPWVSAFYPVDDEITTELVAGNYLVTSIRQREGKFVGNTGFTLMLREKKVFSTRRLLDGDRLVTEPLPRSDVTDVVSGFYYLRNQPLEVGKTVLLQLYDSGKYAPTEVEVLRREKIEVPGLGTVPTLVILPHLKTAAIFRRTGDILIWLTADSRKVPVRVETSIPIGAVRAELVSSEVERGPEERRGEERAADGAHEHDVPRRDLRRQ